MAEALILEFSGVSKAQYDAVNEKLGVDMNTGTGAWPAGLEWHAAGTSDDGTFVVTEVWSSRDAHDHFMHTRLGAALSGAGVTSEPKVTWVSLLAHHTPNA